MTGQKRVSEGIEERSELGVKRVKMRDLDSILQSEGIDTHYPKALKSGDPVDHNESANVRMSKVNRNTLKMNSNARVVEDTPPLDDLNKDPVHNYKSYEQTKARDAFSECGSTCGALEEKDSMRVWKEMKQNGFLSSSHGGVPIPKPRGRKPKNEGIKKKMEIAKREQVNRFAKIAAPSGLLNELNPGIINHVRNRKQVHSIIEALVRSERHENRHAGSKQVIGTKSIGKEVSDGKDLENGNDSTMNRFGHHNDDDSDRTERGDHHNITSSLYPNREYPNDIVALKLSSSATMASENMRLLTNEKAADLSSVTSLSYKAANVASHWLEFLHQDIKERLTALRHSKKRVHTVIQTELPLLISTELSADSVAAEMHKAKWSTLFDQMDKALSEEEKQLESSLSEVKEMLLRCDRGLLECGSVNGLQLQATVDKDCRVAREDTIENALAVRAAAASIYSTCNFLQSMEILPCC